MQQTENHKPLNQRQQVFVDEYLKTGNYSAAARAAGYTSKNVRNQAWQLMQNPVVAEAIKRRLEEVKTERTADLQETLEFVTKVLRGETKDEIAIPINVGRGMSEVRKIKVCSSTKERLKAAEYFLKINGAFKNEVQITGAIPIVISGADKLED